MISVGELAQATGAELKIHRCALVARQNRLAWAARGILDGGLREHYVRLQAILRQWDRLDHDRLAVVAELLARDAMTREQLS